MRLPLLFVVATGCTTVYSLQVNVRVPVEVQRQAVVHTIGALEKDVAHEIYVRLHDETWLIARMCRPEDQDLLLGLDWAGETCPEMSQATAWISCGIYLEDEPGPEDFIPCDVPRPEIVNIDGPAPEDAWIETGTAFEDPADCEAEKAAISLRFEELDFYGFNADDCDFTVP